MRLSREKINLLSHQITEKLASMDEVQFIEDRNTIRLAIVDILNKWLKKEETVDLEARRKIESQTRKIPEGSAEWDILYRKYCAILWSDRIRGQTLFSITQENLGLAPNSVSVPESPLHFAGQNHGFRDFPHGSPRAHALLLKPFVGFFLR